MIKVKGGRAALKGTLPTLGAELAVAAKSFVEANVAAGVDKATTERVLRHCVELAIGEEKGAAENV